MKVAVVKERRAHERRVAASPDTVRRMTAMGLTVSAESGAGEAAGFTDAAFAAAGAAIMPTAEAALADADIVLKVQRPLAGENGAVDELRGIPRGAVLVGLLQPLQNPGDAAAYADGGISAFAMELVPRITRAQAMDALSSQANLAGYKAVIDAADEFNRAFPMMMTAAGTIKAARVLVMGAGVAGLQAIATARRLGAIVSATDVRAAAKEQVESLGAAFVAVDEEAARSAETAGGYAREMGEDYQRRQREKITEALRRTDVVICTALDSRPPGAGAGDARDGRRDDAGLGHRRPRGRGRRQCRGQPAGRGRDHRERRQDRRASERALAHRRRREPALRPQPVVVFGADRRQGRPSGDRPERRDRQGELADAGRGGRQPAADAGSGRGPGRGLGQLTESGMADPAALAERARELAGDAGRLAHGLQALAYQLAAQSPAATGPAGGVPFVYELTVFVLAVFVGYHVVWRVTPALHSPLMSVTNAISSVIIVGALIAAGPAGISFAKVMGFVAVALASVNIFGGFIVTQRMLQMFQRKK